MEDNQLQLPKDLQGQVEVGGDAGSKLLSCVGDHNQVAGNPGEPLAPDGDGDGDLRNIVEEIFKAYREEEDLREAVASLKRILSAANKATVDKQDEVDKLSRQLQEIMKPKQASASSSVLKISDLIKKEEEDLVARYAGLILPEEIWEMVLNNLTSASALQNCFKTCSLFAKVLRPFRERFLFPLVFPHLCRYLENASILNCRQVCKIWTEAVDNFVEEHPSNHPFDGERFNPQNPDLAPPLKRNGNNLHEFSNDQNDLREMNFLAGMRGHPRNPFVGRAVSIQLFEHFYEIPLHVPFQARDRLQNFLPQGEAAGLSVPEQKQLFWDALLDFLQTFGEHIFYLNLEFFREGPVHPEGVSMLQFLTRDLFILVPNLRKLRICGGIGASDALWLTPQLVAPKLETLQLDKITKFETGCVISNLIPKLAPQLKKLQVTWMTWKYVFRFGLDWSNLVELHLDGVNGMLNLNPLLHAKMPHLVKLVLTPGRCPREIYHFPSIMKVVMGLSNVCSKLQVLRLFNGFEDEEVASAPRHLYAPPSFKTLEVEHLGTLSNYSFLSRFPFLENLIIFWPRYCMYIPDGFEIEYKQLSPSVNYGWRTAEDGEEEGMLMDLHKLMCQKRVYESDVWELLPRLKNFTFQRDLYTREEYQYQRLMAIGSEQKKRKD